METTIESQSTTHRATQPNFREDSSIPDGYLANLLVFFALFIGIGAIAVKLLKGRFASVRNIMPGRHNRQSLVEHTERLSSGTRLYFIDYQGTSLVVVESKTGTSIQVLSHLTREHDKAELPVDGF